MLFKLDIVYAQGGKGDKSFYARLYLPQEVEIFLHTAIWWRNHIQTHVDG